MSEYIIKKAEVSVMYKHYILTGIGRNKCSRQHSEPLDYRMEAVMHSDFEEDGATAVDYADNLREQVWRIDGLDIERGLQKFVNRDVYFKILRSYSASLTSLLETVESVSSENLADYEIAVHGIKGASRDVFAESVGESAARLERAAKSGDLTSIRQHQLDFLTAVHKLAGDINALIALAGDKTQKPKKDKPDTNMLIKLLAACEVYDMDGVDTAISQIEEYEYESDRGLAAWLRERADVTDFSAIVQKLAI